MQTKKRRAHFNKTAKAMLRSCDNADDVNKIKADEIRRMQFEACTQDMDTEDVWAAAKRNIENRHARERTAGKREQTSPVEGEDTPALKKPKMTKAEPRPRVVNLDQGCKTELADAIQTHMKLAHAAARKKYLALKAREGGVSPTKGKRFSNVNTHYRKTMPNLPLSCLSVPSADPARSAKIAKVAAAALEAAEKADTADTGGAAGSDDGITAGIVLSVPYH